jgi:N-acylglucosamine-6-phosphate 2-epimerase
VGLICEGGIANAAEASRALAEGADAVVVGTAITGVDLQVARYVEKIQSQLTPLTSRAA